VRTQLKAVYFKTGVRRQAELSRLVGGLALSGGAAPTD
jgi:DNA-binding CsgD family transcriptional regulator